MVSAPTYEQIQPQIIELIKDKIVIGHTLFNDLAVRPFPLSRTPRRAKSIVLFFQVIGHRHQYEMMRDTALYYPLRTLVGVRSEGVWPSLRKLAAAVLNMEMHAAGTAHDPVRLYYYYYSCLWACGERYQEVERLEVRAADIKPAF